MTVPTGARSRVCSYAINVAAGTQNTTLGCGDVTRPVDPIGALDAVTRSGSQVQSVAGRWTPDPDTDAALAVQVYVDGRFAAALTGNGSRPDVAAGSPAGPQHAGTPRS